MPDTRTHRGAHPEDIELFAPDQEPALQTAFAELCWLLDRGYALRSSLALTGNRHNLTQRQRLALARCVCSSEQLSSRLARQVEPSFLHRRELWIDGYNLLISIESALAGSVILLGRDGCYRDVASLHGSYREVAETTAAARLVGATTTKWGVSRCRWLLDQPVGNSGRLRNLLSGLAQEAGWSWQVELAFSPDRILASTTEVVASSDSFVLDRARHWCNVARQIVDAAVASPRIVVINTPARSS